MANLFDSTMSKISRPAE